MEIIVLAIVIIGLSFAFCGTKKCEKEHVYGYDWSEKRKMELEIEFLKVEVKRLESIVNDGNFKKRRFAEVFAAHCMQCGKLQVMDFRN